MTSSTPAKGKKKAVFKALAFLAFIGVAIYVVRFTPVKAYLTTEALGRFFKEAGFWAPLAYMLVYGAGVCLFLPGTLLT